MIRNKVRSLASILATLKIPFNSGKQDEQYKKLRG
jgi:hypothetical protein